jgi:hypothetical protein
LIELAHGVGRVYESPIPTWAYALGAAATVAASFIVRALAPDVREPKPEKRLLGPGAARGIIIVLRVIGLVGLALALVSGVVVRSQGFTLPTLLFWVGLVIGMVILSAIVGGIWPHADPWAALERVYRIEGSEPAHRDPPWWLGPLLLYLLFWFELVSGRGFEATYVVVALALYSVFAFTLRPVFGRHWGLVDPFSILFGFAARTAPLRLDDDGVFYQGPIRDLDRDERMPLALFASVFVLLASTTLDNVRETVGWTEFKDATGLGELPAIALDSVALLAFAVLFFVPFAIAIAAAKRSLRHDLGLIDLARFFGWSLIPIGTAYVIAHNVPLLMTGLPQILRGLSDPFEQGWNLLGTANLFDGYLPSPRLVWFIEIVVIVGGHILGVLAAHRTAVRLGESHRGAVRSQVALTVLMSVFTITTLWLLAQPLVA